MTNNMFLVIVGIIAIIIAFLFVLTAITFIISIIVSKIRKNNVKPIRTFIVIACIMCSVFSFLIYSAVRSQVIDEIYSSDGDFYNIYKDCEKTYTIIENGVSWDILLDTIILDNVTYIQLPKLEYKIEDSENNILNGQLLGKYTIPYQDYYDGEYYIGESLSEIISHIFVRGFELDDDYYVYLYKCENTDYDLIATNYHNSTYCNEAQYDEYLEYISICNPIKWELYSYVYIDENRYWDCSQYKKGTVTEITDSMQYMIDELYKVSGYDFDELETRKIFVENLEFSVDIHINSYEEKALKSDHYSLDYYEDSFYYFIYALDTNTDTRVNIGYKLSDESTAVLKEMIELPDENE